MTPSLTDLAAASRALADQLLPGPKLRYAEFAVEDAGAVARSNVHAVGVGEKITNGEATGQLCLRLHVTQKLAPSLIPAGYTLPAEFRGIPTDVIESPPAYLQPASAARIPANPQPACTDHRWDNQLPLIAGGSFASYRVTGGTLGCFCRSTRAGEENRKYALSAGHVMGSTRGGLPGDPVWRPAPGDGGMPADRIAGVDRFIPIQPGDMAQNLVDAGIALLDPGVAFQNQICTIGAITGTRAAVDKLPIALHGRSAGHRSGIVSELFVEVLVGLRHSDPTQVARFTNQIKVESIDGLALSDGGDSGSLIVDPATNTAVGLLFAGPDSGTYSFANPIDAVFTALEIALL